MNWLLALLGFFLQAADAGERVDPWLILPPSVGPEFERIMSEQNLKPGLGAGWKLGDASITPTSITIQVLHQEENAAVITLERPPAGEARARGRWFAHRVEVLTKTTPQIEAALMEIAGQLDRSFGGSPWKSPGADQARSRTRTAPDGVPCAFCRPVTQSWPFHYTRHPWISLALGALIIIALALGVYLGLRHSRALKGNLL